MRITNQNCILNETGEKLNSVLSCYHSFTACASCGLSENVNIKS